MTRDARLSRSTVAILGLGAALPSPSAPAALQRRAFAFGAVQRAPRSQGVGPGGGPPRPPRADGYQPPAPGAPPPSTLRVAPGAPPDERGFGSHSIAARCSQAAYS